MNMYLIKKWAKKIYYKITKMKAQYLLAKTIGPTSPSFPSSLDHTAWAQKPIIKV